MKVDKRINYMICVDTEACPVDTSVSGVYPSNMFTYDIGWAVFDIKGRVYQTRSFVIYDIFCEEPMLMKSAYYAEKIPKYWKAIKNGEKKLIKFSTAKKIFWADCQLYDVQKIFAHNSRFDIGTLNVTERWCTKSAFRWFFPFGVEICDSLALSREYLAKRPSYIQFCKEHNFMTKHATPRVRLTAEILYRFIANDVDFIESHTALEDVMIEMMIVLKCLTIKGHKKMCKEITFSC